MSTRPAPLEDAIRDLLQRVLDPAACDSQEDIRRDARDVLDRLDACERTGRDEVSP